MKTWKDTFEENYSAVEVPCRNRRGFKIKYVYTGLWYRWKADPAALRRIKCLTAAACAAGIALFMAASLQDSSLNYARYVSLTGTLSIAALLFEVIGIGQFLAAKEKVTGIAFHDIDTKLRVAPVIHFALLLCTAALCVCEMVSGGGQAWDFLIPVLYLLAGACSFAVFALYRRLPYIKEKGEEAQAAQTEEKG